MRKLGYEVFDDWYAAGHEADDKWRDYELARGHTYEEALNGFAARHVFDFDVHHLDRADIGVLALPAGKSGHLELGYLVGKGVPSFILFEDIPERYDVMNLFVTKVPGGKVCFNFGQLEEALRNLLSTSEEHSTPNYDSGPWRDGSGKWDILLLVDGLKNLPGAQMQSTSLTGGKV